MKNKQLNLNSRIFKRPQNKMFIKTKSKLASRVLLCDKFAKGEKFIQNNKTPTKKFNCN